ncbi:hypothetical protein CC80DRAFT_493322 [Byssothecium circinans]|uniref:Uncharacterized protein n=1 Tax=Byssothecium circinans TaxID=147558 RepID=A0A6A5TQK5_9PLEO|nr:hypothetical protein CC80DRAFT_493322 [Byssothecium circinans]
MSLNNHHELPYTAGISLFTLLFGVPIAVVAIHFTNVFVPSITLGTKQIDAGPSGPKTLTIGLIRSSDDAVLASSYISILSSLMVAAGMALVRHLRVRKGDSFVGWSVMGPAAVNLLGQIGCLVAWIILQEKDEAKIGSKDDVTFVDGIYGSSGRMFTREAWACTMKTFFGEKEGIWAIKACEDLKTSREITAGTTFCALIISCISYWQVHKRGGLRWLFGRK